MPLLVIKDQIRKMIDDISVLRGQGDPSMKKRWLSKRRSDSCGKPAEENEEEILCTLVGFLLLEGPVELKRFNRRERLLGKVYGLSEDRMKTFVEGTLSRKFIRKYSNNGKIFVSLGGASTGTGMGMEGTTSQAMGQGRDDREIIRELMDNIKRAPVYLARVGFTSAEMVRKDGYEAVRRFIDKKNIAVEELETILDNFSRQNTNDDHMLVRRGYLPKFPRYFFREFHSLVLEMRQKNKDVLQQVFLIISKYEQYYGKNPVTRDDISDVFGISDGYYYDRLNERIKEFYPRKYLDSRLKTLEKRGYVSRSKTSSNQNVYRTTKKRMFIPDIIENEVDGVMYRRYHKGL